MLHELTTLDIEKAIGQEPCAAEEFWGVYARDQLPSTVPYPSVMVWNTDPASEPGEHWVAAYFTEKGIGEYFDSYGLPPPKPFKNYMDQHSVEWNWNKARLQELWTSACGHFCVFYVIYRSKGIDANEIIDYLNMIENNDQYVMEFVDALL